MYTAKTKYLSEYLIVISVDKNWSYFTKFFGYIQCFCKGIGNELVDAVSRGCESFGKVSWELIEKYILYKLF